MKTNLYLLLLILLVSCSTKKVTTTTPKPSKPKVIETETVSAWDFKENKNLTLSQIFDQAKAQKKLVFVDAYATWCAPCKLMDKEVFTDKIAAKFFNDNFISYKLNIEKNNGETVKLLYSIDVLPTLLFLDADGNVLKKVENSITTTMLKAAAQEALRKAKK